MEEEKEEFCKIIGETPRNRVLEFFIEGREMDFGVGDVAREIGLNRLTTYSVMKELVNNEFLIPSRKVGKGQLYRLNMKKLEVTMLIQLFNNMLKRIASEHKQEVEVET
jgi:DNA-binding IclR family transcriptional regulator